MKLSVVTDEVSSDIETALEVIKSWGVDAIELRSIGGERVSELSEYWQLRLPQLLQEFDLQVAAISPGLFQGQFPRAAWPIHYSRRVDMNRVQAQQQAERQLDRDLNARLPLAIEAAQRLGTRTIVVFSFGRVDHQLAPPAPDEMIQVFRHAADKAQAAGLQLVIEVAEPCSRPGDIVRRVNHPALGINWDPGTAYHGGEDVCYPDGFEQVRPYIRHIHFKDAMTDPETGERCWALDGAIDWPGAIADLRRDGYDGYFSIETHFRPKVGATRATLFRLRALLGQPEPIPEDEIVTPAIRAAAASGASSIRRSRLRRSICHELAVGLNVRCGVARHRRRRCTLRRGSGRGRREPSRR